MKLILQAIKKLLNKNEKRINEVLTTAQNLYNELSPIYIKVNNLGNPFAEKVCIGKTSSIEVTYDELLSVFESGKNGTPIYLYSIKGEVTRVLHIMEARKDLIVVGWVYRYADSLTTYKNEIVYASITPNTYPT